MRDHLLLYVNGEAYRIRGDQAFETLSRFLRYDLGATGTKIVCEEGDCGACTVLVGRRENGALKYRPINSCIQFLFQLDCAHVVTVEGLARGGALTPVQEAMVRCHGAQCGYCTPGFITAMAGYFEDTDDPTAAGVRCALTGNLCRCTGYEPIIKAALEVRSQPKIETLYPSQPILREMERVDREPVRIGNFFRAASLQSAIAFKSEHPKTVIAQGATDFGVWRNKRGVTPEALLSLDAIEGLGDIRVDGPPTALGGGRTLVVGGRVSLAQFESSVRDLVPELAPIMDRFGSPQIKNAGTLAGNIANASPIADTLPFLFVMNATLELMGKNGPRTTAIRDFYKGYKSVDLHPDEIITRTFIPLPQDGQTLRLYKISKRSHLDIASFTAAMLMKRDGGRIDSIRIAYGGVAPVVLRLTRTEELLAGGTFERASFIAAGKVALSEIAPISDVRGTKEYRLQLAENVLQKFYYDAR